MLAFKEKTDRASINIRRTKGRLSVVGRKSNKVDLQFAQTPDFKKNSFSKESRHKK